MRSIAIASSQATLAGHGVPGDTNIPPYHVDWHVPPTTPRTFDLEEAARRLDAAGYKLDADGKRLDKDGKPINLRLTWPDSEEESATNAQFIQEWFGELGISVDAAVTEEGKLLNDLLGPPDGEANWDFYMWGWVGDPDPMSLLSFFTSGPARRPERQLLLEPALRRAVRAPAEGDRPGTSAQGLHRRDAADLLRRCAVPRPVLRQRAACVPDRQVRRLDEPAARERDAAVRVRAVRLHRPEGRQRGHHVADAATGSEAPSASGGTTSPAPTRAERRTPPRQHGPDPPGRGRCSSSWSRSGSCSCAGAGGDRGGVTPGRPATVERCRGRAGLGRLASLAGAR